MPDEKQFCVILRVENPEMAAQVALPTLQNLVVPDGYTLDLLTIEQADSAAQAYQGGMEASGAKYKIYLRENAALLNPNLLGDLLAVFSSDPAVAMVGTVGSQILLPSTRVAHRMWNNKGVVGARISLRDEEDPVEYTYAVPEGPFAEVAVLDDALVATSVDLPWFDDVYTGSYHACMQRALACREQGLKVVVPAQASLWCAVFDEPEAKGELERCFEADKALFLERNREQFPPVCVGIPTFNRPERLQRCVEGALNQTYPNVRVFIGDNSENAKSREMVAAVFEHQRGRIHYTQNPVNIGALANMRAIFERMDTEIVTETGDDDQLTPISLERQMDYFCLDTDKKLSIVGGQFAYYNDKDEFLGILFGLDKLFPSDMMGSGREFIKLSTRNDATIFTSWNNLYRKDRLAEPIGRWKGIDYESLSDRITGYALLLTGDAVFVHEPIVKYTTHEGQSIQDTYYYMSACNDYFNEIQTVMQLDILSEEECRKVVEEAATRFSYITPKMIENLKPSQKKISKVCLQNAIAIKDQWEKMRAEQPGEPQEQDQ